MQNAIVETLTISKDVYDLTLENIKDTVNSSHVFDGGGGESIKLSGDTIFKGEIQITSGDIIQIRAQVIQLRLRERYWLNRVLLQKFLTGS